MTSMILVLLVFDKESALCMYYYMITLGSRVHIESGPSTSFLGPLPLDVLVSDLAALSNLI